MKTIRQFAMFILCGGLAALVNIGSRWILSHWLPYTVAIVVAYGLGMLSGYLLFKFFVFDSAKSKRTEREIFWYVIVNVAALLQTLLISLFLARWFFPKIGMGFRPEDVAHIIGVVIPVFSSYIGHKYFTFKGGNK